MKLEMEVEIVSLPHSRSVNTSPKTTALEVRIVCLVSKVPEDSSSDEGGQLPSDVGGQFPSSTPEQHEKAQHREHCADMYGQRRVKRFN